MNNGAKLRIYNLLRGLSQHHDVTLLSFADQPGGADLRSARNPGNMLESQCHPVEGVQS